MFKHNTYFDHNVQSLGFEDSTGPASVGVMAPGSYEFGTSTREVMTVVSGKLIIRLPGADSDTEFTPGQSFEVASGETFGVRIEEPSSYLCRYGD
jgi:uncharacterized protein YaiE (UPF0345 family)